MPLPPLGLVERSLERDKRLTIIKATTADIVHHGSAIASSQMLNEENHSVHVADYSPAGWDLPGSYNVAIL
jgi:hypothetical protein